MSTRKKSDYYWIGGIYAILFSISSIFYSAYSTVADTVSMYNAINFFNVTNAYLCLFFYFAMNVVMIFTAINIMWRIIKYFDKNISTTYFDAQYVQSLKNMFILSAYKTVITCFVLSGYTKLYFGNFDYINCIIQTLIWIFNFELTWYFQHRLMHDNKFLWKYGHSYHHQWKNKDQMIGITNFAFDHIVEVWVTMSSSCFSIFLFPINYWNEIAISIIYMILAIFVHWDKCFIKYHLNHHYKVNKNFGSHIPMFDMFFNTYAN